MKFLVDAQLPRRLSDWLIGRGLDSIHTMDLPLGNATPDNDLIEKADSEQRFVVSKDDDFVQSYLLAGRPARLLLISTGNIRNDALESLIAQNWGLLENALRDSRFVELCPVGVVVHD